jgi:hypothetical protein
LEKEADEKGLIILSPIYEYLKRKGYLWKDCWVMIEGIPVDIFPADALEKDWMKIGMLLEQCQINRETLSTVLAKYGLIEKFRSFEEGKYGRGKKDRYRG